ncbi:MAG: hypothetical protein E6I02_09810 [Chloroflexi bacterium]|nr:MAG: hypothetical protein E6I02_09810 [Chloroflexota bacterium]
MTVSDQVMLLPDQYLRQGITILRSVIYLARLEEEGRREQALLVRQAMEANGALVTQSAAVSAPATQPSLEPDQSWAQDFRAGDPDRQHVSSSEASGLITALETIIDNLQYTNVTERQLVLEVRAAVGRVRAMGNHEPARRGIRRQPLKRAGRGRASAARAAT